MWFVIKCRFSGHPISWKEARDWYYTFRKYCAMFKLTSQEEDQIYKGVKEILSLDPDSSFNLLRMFGEFLSKDNPFKELLSNVENKLEGRKTLAKGFQVLSAIFATMKEEIAKEERRGNKYF